VSCWDNFTGEEPLPEQQGNERVYLIKNCSDPWDKKCRCEAHRKYFNDTLD